MILRDLLQLVLFIGLLAALSPLLGRYVHQVFSGRRTFLHPVLGPVERGVYSLSGIPTKTRRGAGTPSASSDFPLRGSCSRSGYCFFRISCR